ncbi:hypothetical protein pEaSNUABM50_00055 [Erwinia phage pEa_SNUABM_50]|uniref:Uncharacterized protein n=4 Tax=Eneladusvirus BF TaxID=2560751 RepID=A0A7L8ZMT2_9CAUD|nr:hypothetical protein FDH34_gp057 [Serratia phage BF]QOI70995.1 hypothetical protein pEaSNUABM12_00057 [Erwinia phage pEa_SNUABM_12]QOI71540.1 hypothetical protein pEaSNUABM47_00056 [Erwinia phage pEa_SNUABM_47]QOI72079.1 hypothetical protein pEaSNUABM50_00055 [Erwinia phage pEa_SNUABM_50]QXO11204.1 hypothetical protein pEaSNUABM19_00058 [Erwinia phage pEa_SNUABM_19]QXO11752.1 hypothetical protein pEaSNUABM44_00056 [Erwinia phage pEa_SNUABM_44]QXO12303.1 hypothetical protein pEaSNUABM49_000
MNKTHSTSLKAITGVILINKDGEDHLYCIDDMQHTKHFTIGQIFNAVRVLYGKEVHEYGKLWPHYKVDEVVSNDWKAIQSAMESCTSDYDFLVEACKQLNEEVPEIVPRDKVQQRLEMYKETVIKIASQAQ